VAQTISDLVIVEIDSNILSTSDTIAIERVKHEYDRFGLSYKERIAKIKAGIIGELMFCQQLSKLGIPYLYYFVVGRYDEGYDFRVGKVKIDIKTTTFNKRGKSIQDSSSLIFNRFNLYVADDTGQAQKRGADIYIQAFTLDEDECIFAGYSWGVPKESSENPRNIFPPKKRPIPSLEPIASLYELEETKAICVNCGQPVVEFTSKEIRGDSLIDTLITIPEQMAESYRKYDRLLCNRCK
jgi:hypothetical protein